MQSLRIVFLFLAIVFTSVFTAPALAFTEPTPQKRSFNIVFDDSNLFPDFINFDDVESDVFYLVNSQRKKYRLNPLNLDGTLSKMARYYSRKMAKEDFFSHYDSEGNSVVDRAEKFNVKNYRKIGENLFFSEGFSDPSDLAVKGWLKSPSHRKNLLSNDWSHTGIGVYTTNDGRTYITQVFLKK